jgi:CRISPR-associated protein Cmr2
MPQDIVLLNIGSVQEYISTSRRTLDLAISSQLVSLLALNALRCITTMEGVEILIPQKINGVWPVNVPNRLMLLSNENQGAEVAGKMVEAIQQKWSEISSQTKNIFNQSLGNGSYSPEGWQQQVQDWPEIYWVTTPWDGKDETFSKALKTANLGLDARKNMRFIPSTAQPGEKCSLCGIRSALGDVDHLWKLVRQKEGARQIRKGEKLCAICTIKRFASRLPDFQKLASYPSVSTIATTSYRLFILEHWQDDLASKVSAYLKLLNDDGIEMARQPGSSGIPRLDVAAGTDEEKKAFISYDGDIFFEEYFQSGRYRDDWDEDRRLSPDQIKVLTGALKDMNRAAAKIKKFTPDKILSENNAEGYHAYISHPTPYYALLAMDGDYMGRTIDNVHSKQELINISQALVKSAQSMKKIVETEYPGRLIYSGGEDVLAFLPLDCALPAADRLRKKFEEALKESGQSEATASTGISISHHSVSLESTLNDAHKAEAIAKNLYDRNALVVNLSKRSGSDRCAGAHWWSTKLNYDPLEQLRLLISQDIFSGKFATDLQSNISTFDISAERIPNVIKSEITRLAHRHVLHQPEPIPGLDEKIKVLISKLHTFTGFIPQVNGIRPPEVLSLWMLIIRFIAQGEQE